MSTGIDIQIIRENYQRMTDGELIQIATQDAAGLTPEAREVVKQEVAKRRLDVNIIEAVSAQNKEYTIEEIDSYCDIIRGLDCPACGAIGPKLNATMTSEVMSFLLFTHYSRKLKVACPECLDKANDAALTKSVLLGWWGIPWGIIRTIQAINHNVKGKKTNHTDSPNDYLRGFTLSKIGELEAYKSNKEKLQEVISGN